MSTRTRKGLIAAAAVAVLGAGGAAIAVATDEGGEDDGPDRAITGAAFERASDAALQHTGGGRVTATEVGDEESYYEVEVTRDDGSQTDVQLDRDFGVVGSEADGREDDDEDEGPDGPITGAALERASDAALQHTGGGRVTDTEVGDEGQVDVQLDKNFNVVSSESDSDEGDDED